MHGHDAMFAGMGMAFLVLILAALNFRAPGEYRLSVLGGVITGIVDGVLIGCGLFFVGLFVVLALFG